MKSTIASAILLATTLCATPAFATDALVIKVPVQFSNLDPSVEAVIISCTVNGKDAVTQQMTMFGGGARQVLLPLTKGAYTGPSPVTVVFKLEDFKDSEKQQLNTIVAADCNFGLKSGTHDYQPYADSTGPILGHKPGTKFEWKAGGTFK